MLIRSAFSGAVLIRKEKQNVIAHSHDLCNQEIEIVEQEFRASLGYSICFWLPWATYRKHVSQQIRKKIKILRKTE